MRQPGDRQPRLDFVFQAGDVVVGTADGAAAVANLLAEGCACVHGSLLLVELGAIILGLGPLGAVSIRFGISPIPLYLLAGLAFGQGGLLPLATSEEFIATGAEIGVILLLFTLGLAYTSSELVDTLRTSAVSGNLDLGLSAAPGVIIALALGWGPVAALVLGGITIVTSSGITAKLLSDLDWIGNREPRWSCRCW